MMRGQRIDRLPSQIDFVPHRLESLLGELRMTAAQFDDFADNHIFHLYPLTESCYYSSGSEADQALVDLAVSRGFIEQHPDPRMVFDNFHVAWLKNRDGIRNMNVPLEAANAGHFAWPDPTVKGLFDHAAPSLAANRELYYVVGLQHLGLFERAHLLMGYQAFMIALSEDIPFVEELLDRILEFHLGLANRFIEVGIDAIRTGDDYGMQEGLQMDPRLWRRLIKPRLAKIWERYRNADVTVMHHSCGNIISIIPDLLEIGLEVLHPVQPKAMSIEELAERFADRLVFFGGVDTQELFPFGSPAEVRAATSHCMDVLGRNGRYIVAPSQEIMNDVPTRNILEFIETVRQQGRKQQ
jgi:uroporphyrinogen decarboxylase